AAALQRCRAGVLKGHVRSSSCEWRERRPARGDLAPAQGILRTADRGVKSLGSVGLATGGGSDRENAMQQLRTEVAVKELSEITIKTDTRDILAHATIQAEALEDYFLVDIDAHVTETSFWNEIIDLIDNDVIRQMGQAMASRPGTSTALLNA